MAAGCACPLIPRDRRVSHSSFYHSEGYPTVKAALRHESADSEEDREGLGCHLGQGQRQSLASFLNDSAVQTNQLN